MAATNFTPIQLYYSTTASAAPSAGNLLSGELAVNIADGKLFYKDSGGVVQTLATKGTGTIGGSTTQVQYNSGGSLAGSSNLTFDGTALTMGANPTLSAGTANGILYLNGSKVATSGSALTFDGTNLGVGTSNPAAFGLVAVNGASASVNINATTGVAAFKLFEGAGTGRGSITSLNGSDGLAFLQGTTEAMRLTSTGLGIGTSSPARTLDIRATSPFIRLQETGSGGDKRLELSVDGSGVATISAPQSAQSLAFSTVGSERMRLDSSGNLGIGTSSPGSKLHVNGAVRFGNGTALGLIDYSSTDIYFANLVTGGALTWYTNGAERMRLDASGNLGLWVTPSAWNSGLRAIQVGYSASIDSPTSVVNTRWSNNAFVDSSGGFKYINTAVAQVYEQDNNGKHIWYTAPSGTAGNAISFTQSMTLDASGNLGVGTSSPISYGGGYVTLGLNGSNAGVLDLMSAGVSQFRLFGNGFENRLQGVTNVPITFYTNNAERMRLDSSGNLGIGTSSPRSVLDLNTTRTVKAYWGTAGTLGETQSTAGDYIANNLYVSAESAATMTYTKTTADSGNAVLQDFSRGITFYTGVTGAATTTGTLNSFERMRLDSSGNLGLGVTPSAWSGYGAPALEMPSGGTVVGQGSTTIGASFYYSGGVFRYSINSNASYYNQNAGIHAWYTAPSGTAGNAITFTQAMTLDASGNLGVGTTSPGARLHINGAGLITAKVSSSSGNPTLTLDATGINNADIYVNRSTSALVFYNYGADRLTLDASGNLGLGVTPSATSSPYKSIELFGAYWMGGNNTTPASYSYTNAYFDGSDKYKTSGFAASLYRQLNGTHSWHTAPSGTAGNAITFTQSMTLDASGNLGVGVTSISGFRADILSTSTDAALRARSSNSSTVLTVESAGTSSAQIRFINTSVNNTYISAEGTALTFITAGNERSRITSTGNQIDYQPAESAQNTSVTLTAANLQAQIITSNAAVTLTLPTGTSLEGYTTSMAVDTAFEVTFIATTANAITIGANGNTTVGNLTVSGNTSGTFRFRKTANNTFTVYRIS